MRGFIRYRSLKQQTLMDSKCPTFRVPYSYIVLGKIVALVGEGTDTVDMNKVGNHTLFPCSQGDRSVIHILCAGRLTSVLVDATNPSRTNRLLLGSLATDGRSSDGAGLDF